LIIGDHRGQDDISRKVNFAINEGTEEYSHLDRSAAINIT